MHTIELQLAKCKHKLFAYTIPEACFPSQFHIVYLELDHS